MLKPWLYERDAPTVLARRNEAYAALHGELSTLRFGWTPAALDRMRETLQDGPIRQRLDSLPLARDPITEQLADLEEQLQVMLGDGDYEVNAGSLERLVNEVMSALETACTQTSFPREDWPGAFAKT